MISPSSVILKQYRNAQKINLEALLIDIAKKNEQLILDIHRDQLRRGEGGSGKMPKYFAGYLNYKKSLPSYFGGGNADWYISGQLQEQEFIRFDSKEYEISSKVSYLSDLLDNPRYGDDGLKLNPNSIELVQEKLTPIFNKELHQQLNK